MRLFTTAEAAEYLRLKERKLYELVAEGAIPCTKVTGKWLFPKDELDAWLSNSLTRPNGLNRPDPMPIVGGSHDLLLEWSLRESGCGLAILAEGSEAGLQRLQSGELVAAGIHLHALEGNIDANLEALRTRPALHDTALIAFARREAGILVAPRNPLRLTGLKDIARTRARMATRPQGTGAQLFLQALLFQAKIGGDEIAFEKTPSPTGADVAQAIKAGRADCGIAARAVANGAGLDFIPLIQERFDLVVRQRDYFRPPMQTLVTFFHSPTFAARAKEIGGYDISDIGVVRATP